MKNLIFKLLKVEKAYAHCDVPCGIYDPKPAVIAAATVLKMVQKLNELITPKDGTPDSEFTKHHNDVVRMIMTKEEHARKCKEEILILWTDFFKPEDIKNHPELHELIWLTTKLISKNKQEVSIESAEELVTKVNTVAELFNKVSEERKLAAK